MRVASAPAIAVFLLLGGCVGPTDPAVSNGAVAGMDGGAALAGLVIDDTLAPLVDVVVTIDHGERVLTDEAGRFLLEGLTPGTHSVLAEKIGYATTFLEVDLIEEERLEVRIVLLPSAVAGAYHETQQQSGFVGCSFGWGLPVNVTGYESSQLAVCGVPQLFGVEGLDHFMTFWLQPNLGQDFAGAWGETTWVSNQALSHVMMVIWFAIKEHAPVLEAELGEWNTTHGTSPIRLALRADVLRNLTLTDGSPVCPDMTCVLYAGHYATYDRTQSPSVVALVQQRYDDYLTIFHGGRFPEGFSALPDQ